MNQNIKYFVVSNGMDLTITQLKKQIKTLINQKEAAITYYPKLNQLIVGDVK